jgi:hypothetical protein
MGMYSEIPSIEGLYAYVVNGKLPEPVLIDSNRYGESKFKGFDGRIQSWLGKDKSLIGPIELPNSI